MAGFVITDVQHIERADGHRTTLTSNKIILGWSLASSVLYSEIFKDFLLNLSLKASLKDSSNCTIVCMIELYSIQYGDLQHMSTYRKLQQL